MKVATTCFAAILAAGIGMMVYGVVVVPIIPYAQVDVILTPEELADPAKVAATLAMLKKAVANLSLLVTLAGLVITLLSGLGVSVLRQKAIRESVEEQESLERLGGESNTLTLKGSPRLVLLLLLPLLACTIGVGLWLLTSANGIRVAVHNAGPHTLHNVIVHVTGNHYDIGDLAAKELRVVRVDPTGDSHVEIEFTDSNRLKHRGVADSYFEPGNRGTITINIRNNAISALDSSIKPAFF